MSGLVGETERHSVVEFGAGIATPTGGYAVKLVQEAAVMGA
jgi:hypothetical protein